MVAGLVIGCWVVGWLLGCWFVLLCLLCLFCFVCFLGFVVFSVFFAFLVFLVLHALTGDPLQGGEGGETKHVGECSAGGSLFIAERTKRNSNRLKPLSVNPGVPSLPSPVVFY